MRRAIATPARDLERQRGAAMLEYAFLIALIAIVVVAAAMYFGTELNGNFSDVGETMQAY